MNTIKFDPTISAFQNFDLGHSAREVADTLGISFDHAVELFRRYAETLRATAHDERFTRRVMMRSKIPLALEVLEGAARLEGPISKDEAAAWNVKVKAAQTLLGFASRHSEDDPVTWNTERPAERKVRGKFTYHSVINDTGASTLFAEWAPEDPTPEAKPEIVEAEVTFDATDFF